MSRLSDDAVTLRHVVRFVSSLATAENCRRCRDLGGQVERAVRELEGVRLAVASLAEEEATRKEGIK